MARSWGRVHKNADAAVPSLRDRLYAFWLEQRAAINAEELTRRLEQDGAQAQVIDWLAYEDGYRRILEPEAVQLCRKTALDLVGDTIALSKSLTFAEPDELRFDIRNLDAEAFLATTGAFTNIRGLYLADREAIRRLLIQSFAKGVPPHDTARLIQNVLGDLPEQAAAIQRYADNLPPELSPEQAARRVHRFQQHLERYRAETIARTETIRAANAGQMMAWDRAAARGLLPVSRTGRLWIVTPDDRLCARCQLMRGEVTTLTGAWRAQSLSVISPPLHPRCRCAQGLVFDGEVPLQ